MRTLDSDSDAVLGERMKYLKIGLLGFSLPMFLFLSHHLAKGDTLHIGYSEWWRGGLISIATAIAFAGLSFVKSRL